MRWFSHELVAFGVLVNIASFGEVVLGLIGSILPDVVETRVLPWVTLGRVRVAFRDTERRLGVWYVEHRGFFHDLALWLGVFVGLYVVDVVRPLWVYGSGLRLSVLGFGALLHIGVDALSGSGVPVFGRRVRGGVYVTGSVMEYLISWGVLGCGLAVFYFRTQGDWAVVVSFLDGVFPRLWGVLGRWWWVFVVPVVVWGLWCLRGRLGRRDAVVEDDGEVEVFDISELVKNYRYGVGSPVGAGVVDGGAGLIDLGGGSDGSGDGAGEAASGSSEAGEVAGAGLVSAEAGGEAVVSAEAGGAGGQEAGAGDGAEAEAGAGGAEGTGGEVVPEWLTGDLVEVWRGLMGFVSGDGERCVVERVMRVLVEHGGKSSVHVGLEGHRGVTYEVLSGVSLLEHGVDVFREGMRLLRAKYPDTWERYAVGVGVACLAHDLGKVDELVGRGADYSKDDHALDGATWLLGVMKECGVGEWFMNEVYEAVRNHHRFDGGGGLIGAIVVEADREARRREYEKYGKDVRVAEKHTGVDEKDGGEKELVERVVSGALEAGGLPGDFPHDRLLEELWGLVNFPKERRPSGVNEWRSLSQPDGYVYFKLDFLGEFLREFCERAGYRDFDLVSSDVESGKKRVKMFVDYWRSRGWLHEAIREGFYSQRYKVYDGFTRKEFVVRLVALRVDAFGRKVSEAEVERQEYPRLRLLRIEGVAPSEGGE